MLSRSANANALTLQQTINLLQSNDPNGTWDELTTVADLKECLQEAMSNYLPAEYTYKFYNNILKQLP